MKWYFQFIVTALAAASPGIFLYFYGVYRWKDWRWINKIRKEERDKRKAEKAIKRATDFPNNADFSNGIDLTKE